MLHIKMAPGEEEDAWYSFVAPAEWESCCIPYLGQTIKNVLRELLLTLLQLLQKKGAEE
jgi:hypothetical protein